MAPCHLICVLRLDQTRYICYCQHPSDYEVTLQISQPCLLATDQALVSCFVSVFIAALQCFVIVSLFLFCKCRLAKVALHWLFHFACIACCVVHYVPCWWFLAWFIIQISWWWRSQLEQVAHAGPSNDCSTLSVITTYRFSRKKLKYTSELQKFCEVLYWEILKSSVSEWPFSAC